MANWFIIQFTILIGVVCVFLLTNAFAFHYSNSYNIMAVLMIIPIGTIITVREFLP